MPQNKVVKNASWMIGCKILQMIINLWVVKQTSKYLGPGNYGLISYAESLVTFTLPIMQLGLSAILVRALIAHPEKEGEIMGTSLTMSFFSSLICIGGLALFVLLQNGDEKDTVLVCILYSISLIFQSIEQIAYWFQAKYKSKYPSIVMLVAFVFVSIYKIYLLVTEKSVYWFALPQSISYIIMSAILFVIYNKIGGQKMTWSRETAKMLLSESKYYIIPNLMVTIFAQTDHIMIKNMMEDGNFQNGFYSAAVICANLSGFIFTAIIDASRPSILESKTVNQELFEKNVSRLYCIIIYLSLAQSIFMTIFAKYIINILYSPTYYPSISALRIIVWYTTFSYFGAVRNIWILAEGKQKYLWIINLSGAAANVVLNCFLIPVMGINGAALASLVTQIFTNVIVNQIIKPIRYNNKLMLRGLDPRILYQSILSVKKQIITKHM